MRAPIPPPLRRLGAVLLAVLAAWPLAAAPVAFDLPAQTAADALLAFSAQAQIEVLFPFDELRQVRSTPVQGQFEPAEALARLLRDTGFTARRNRAGKFVATRSAQAAGSIRGRLVLPGRQGAAGIPVALPGTARAAVTDRAGAFEFPGLPPATYRVRAAADGFRPVEFAAVPVESGLATVLPAQTLEPAESPMQLEPYVVEGRSARLRPIDDSAALLGPRRATGNLDLPRGESDALPFNIYTREQITRSGVVALNEFLQRAILEGDAATRPPEQSASFNPNEGFAGSSNLRLRGYDENETVILINGRRLPEVQTSVTTTLPPDVNFIPLSLIQQVEVLPASASALYNGNPVGGVINIVLRPDVNATEVSATYTNALHGYDAPQSSLSLQHGQTLLDGRLRVRLNAVRTAAEPVTEAEAGYRRALDTLRPAAGPLHRATPNVRSTDDSPLFDAGTPAFTSVAPDADGAGGLGAFNGRAGLENRGFFDGPGGLAASPVSLDSPYGKRQHREVWFASVTLDPVRWLQAGVDATYSRTTVHRGYDLLSGDLTLAAGSPLNPFGRAVTVSLLEAAPALGEEYGEARIDFTSAVAGLLLRLPSDWRVSLDLQAARNVVKYRGLAGADPARWQQLVDAGRYNPLRDTQAYAPPSAFYDEVLIYRGGRGRFVTLGDYDTLDGAARVSNQALDLPTGRATFLAGADYRRHHLDDYAEQAVYADGTPAAAASERTGRTLQRYSFFTELQAPVLPAHRLPAWLHRLEADAAVRYVASANSNEVNTAPTLGLRAVLAGGFTLRGSVTYSNRFPTPQLSKAVAGPVVPGGGLNEELLYDSRRNETYAMQVNEAVDPGLPPEDAVTQTAGVIFERGDFHRFRATLDFVDTRKTNEILALDARGLLNVEGIFPDRVIRAPLAGGDPHAAGRVTQLVTGSVNASWRRSQNWTAGLDYSWDGCLGGTLELHGRVLYYQRYQRQVFASSPVVDELDHPDGTAPSLLRYRATLGTAWSNRTCGFGLDGQYFHARILPTTEQANQGSDRIRPYWQFDAYTQADLVRLFRLKPRHYGLRGQLRVNNLSGFDFPKYANDASGTGVQPYGDWRGRTYSLSLTATF